MKFPVGRLIWEARGHSLKSVSAALKARFPGEDGYSVANIQRRAVKTTEEIPDEVAKVILALPIEKGFEEPAEVLRLGLAALEGGPLVDVEALASSLRDKLPRVDPEVIARAIEALAADVRALAGSVDGHAKREERERGEDRANVGELRTVVRRGFVTTGVLSVAVGVLVVACLYPSRAAGPGDAAHTRGGGVAEEAAGEGLWMRLPFLGPYFAGETSEKTPTELYIPAQPLKGQKRDHCNPNRGESLINGGCWGNMGDVKPPAANSTATGTNATARFLRTRPTPSDGT